MEAYDCHVLSSSLMNTSIMIDHDRVTLCYFAIGYSRISILPVLFSHFSRVALRSSTHPRLSAGVTKRSLDSCSTARLASSMGVLAFFPCTVILFTLGLGIPGFAKILGLGDRYGTMKEQQVQVDLPFLVDLPMVETTKPFHQIQAAKEMR